MRVYLAPDPRSEANLPEYPLREELAFPQVLGAGPVGERAVLGEQGLTGVSTGVRGVFMVATSEDRSSPVLYAPNAPTPYVLVPSVRMPSEGRVVREAYRSWVSNDLAKIRLGWAPAHSFELGAQRTGEWMRFARII